MSLERDFPMTIELNLDAVAQAIVEDFMPDEILSFVKALDEKVADEDFTLDLALWARGEENKILAERAGDGDLELR